MADFCTVNQSLVNGFMKLCICQFYLLSWLFLVYDFDRTCILDIQKQSNAFQKKWAGINKSAENGLLFRSKENFGLGLTSIVDNY